MEVKWLTTPPSLVRTTRRANPASGRPARVGTPAGSAKATGAHRGAPVVQALGRVVPRARARIVGAVRPARAKARAVLLRDRRAEASAVRRDLTDPLGARRA